MNAADAFVAALQSLRVNVLRSVLTTLGIIIGVGAVITMVAVGTGAERQITNTIRSLGSNLLIVIPSSSVTLGGGREPSALTEADADAIAAEIPGVLVSAPSVQGQGQVIAGNLNWATSIVGVTPPYFQAREWLLAAGRYFTEDEARGGVKVAILGSQVASELFPGMNPVGQHIRVQRVPFRVVGMMQEKGQGGARFSQDDVIFMPLAAARNRVLGRSRVQGDQVSQIAVKVVSEDAVDRVDTAVTELLRLRHRLREGEDDDFYVNNLGDIMEASQSMIGIMQMLLTSIASISLVVGGIGIMNIMLVTVTERTREIGLRMATGARSRDILAQFVIEAVTLSVIGGGIGIVIGYLLSSVLSTFIEFDAIVNLQAVVWAFAVSAGIGIFFGFYPARKASRLNPIDALRYE